MISTSIRTLPGCVKPATQMAGGTSEERDAGSPSPLLTRIRTLGFRDSAFAGRHGSITVPASPATISAMSSSAPMVALLPVFSTKVQAASTLGPIEPAGKSW